MIKEIRGMLGGVLGFGVGVLANLGLLAYTNFFAVCSVACIPSPLTLGGVALAILLIPTTIGRLIDKWREKKKKKRKSKKK